MASIVYIFIALKLFLFFSVDAGRILAMMPTPSRAHGFVFSAFVEALAKRGHQVVVITAYSTFTDGPTPANLTEINVSNVTTPLFEYFLTKEKGNKDAFMKQIYNFMNFYSIVVEKQLKTDAVQKLLQNRDEHFDLLILEAYVHPLLVLSHFYKVPVIQISSTGPTFTNLETIGAPSHPIMYPTFMVQKLNNLSWWDKLSQLFSHFIFQGLKGYYDYQSRFVNTSSLDELRNNVNLLLLNIHEIHLGNFPVPPSVIYMGRKINFEPQELPQVCRI